MVCDECSAPVPDDARWCGRCGAGVGVAEPTPTPQADGPEPGPRHRHALLGAAVVLAVVAVVTLLRPGPVPTGTLGHLDVPPGLVADGALRPGTLTIAWEHDPAGADGPAPSVLVQVDDPTLLGDGLLRVDQLVVDLASGSTVGALPVDRQVTSVGDGRVTLLVDGERVTHDVRTGRVVDRVPLAGVTDRPPFVVSATPDGTLVAVASGTGGAGTVLVAPDGAVRPAIPPAVIEQLLGTAASRADAAWEATPVGPVFVVEVFPLDDGTSGLPPRHVVDAASGELLGEIPGGSAPSLLVPVGGGVATVLDGQVLWAIGPDGGESRLELGVGDGPGDLVLLGAVDGRLVVARRGGDGTWTLLHVPAPPWDAGADTPTTIGTVDPRPRGQRSAPWTTSPPGILEVNDATVTDELVVVIDDDGAAIVARDLTGAERWRRPASEGALLGSAGDLVLVTEPSAVGTRATLLDGDGAQVWRDVTGGPRFAADTRLVHGDVVHTDATFPLRAATGEPVTERDGDGPGLGATPLAVVDDPDGIGSGVLTTRRTGGAEGTEIIAVGDDPVLELTSGELGSDLLVGVADGVLLVRETRVASMDRVGFASLTDTSVLVRPDGTRIEVDGTFSTEVHLGRAELARVAAVMRDDGTALLDPTTGEPRFVLAGRVSLTDAGNDRLVAAQRSGWWVVDAADGSTVGERRDVLVQALVVGDGLVATAGLDGSLVVVDTDDGRTAWQRPRSVLGPSAMVFTGDHLLVGTRDGRVIEHDGTGAVVRTTAVGDGPVGSIAVADGTLVVGVDDTIRGFRLDGDGLTSRDEVVVP